MKLAEALMLRADLQRRIQQLRDRLQRNAKVQEGDTPAEDPNALIQELDAAADQLQRLIRQINHTNVRTEISDGETLTDALAERDVLRIKSSAFRDLANAATVQQQRYSRSEVRFVSTVDVRGIRKRADDLAKQYRELDSEIQATNWQTDLISDAE